jgi:hypothetical protein
MVPAHYHPFPQAQATLAGALIGPLLVAAPVVPLLSG